MQLDELAEQAITFIHSTTDNEFSVHEVYRLLDVRGTRNRHLANPLNQGPNAYYFRPRAESLTGNEPVFGDFLSLMVSEHDPLVFLEDHDDLESLKRCILSDSGPFNFFVTGVAAFVESRLMPYRLRFCKRDGTVVDFSKFDEYAGVYTARERFGGREIEWTAT